MCKTINGISHKLALLAIQHIAYERDRRIITSEHDITDQDAAEVKAIANHISKILRSADGRRWWAQSYGEPNVCDDIIDACGGMHLGFATQDAIIATLTCSGIRLTDI